MNSIETLIDGVALIAKDKPKGLLFAKHEGVIVPKHEHPHFKKYVFDNCFTTLNYTALVSGTYSAKHGAMNWSLRLSETFRLYRVPHLLMYFRPETHNALSVRILANMDEFRETVERYYLK